MCEINDALEGLHLRIVVQARAPRSDTAFRAGRRHFNKHQRCAAQGSRAQMHQVKVLHQAVDGAVSGHGRNNHAVLKLNVPYF